MTKDDNKRANIRNNPKPVLQEIKIGKEKALTR